jgi:cytochrome c-type biogenesis protein CcmH/NrfG
MAESAVGGARRAQGLRRAGRNSEAATAYRRYLKRNPADADAWRGLGLCYIALNRPDDAGYSLWQALRHRPDSLPLMMQLGDVLVRAGDMERAATLFEHTAKRHPGEIIAYLPLSAVQRQLGQ